MKKINIRRLYYHVRHNYFTLNNVVIVIAFAIAAGWVWGSLGVMQRNYDLQKGVDYKQRQLQLIQLQTASLQLESRYYKTQEYQELAARQDLGLALPGESVLILPANSQSAIDADKQTQTQVTTIQNIGNYGQWMNFLFGADSKNASS
jgi:cell division protein FtsB